jgi:hypothetical protein
VLSTQSQTAGLQKRGDCKFFDASVKEVVQPRLVGLALVTLSVAKVGIFEVGLALMAWRVSGHRGGGGSGRPFQQLIELAPVKPNATASGAVVNLDALSIGHHQGGVRAVGAFHVSLQELQLWVFKTTARLCFCC